MALVPNLGKELVECLVDVVTVTVVGVDCSGCSGTLVRRPNLAL